MDSEPTPAQIPLSAAPVNTKLGEIAGLMGVATEETRQVVAEHKRERLELARQNQQAEEKARTEEELRNSATLLRGISDSTGDAIFAKDRDGRLRFANPATLALLGKPLEQVIGKTDAVLLEDQDAARMVMANDRRIIDSGMAEDIEEFVPLSDGTGSIWFSRKVPYRDADGRIIGLLGISRDITERKAAEDEIRNAREAAEAPSQAKDHLLAVVSHELRTPLNPILAITSYLQTRTDLAPDLREDFDTIRRNIEQEARIVDDLLSLTRLHRGKIVLHHEVVDLHAMIQSALEECAEDFTSHQIETVMSLGAAQPLVWADPTRIRQVLSNLIGNAVKFTPDRGRITLRTSTPGTDTIRIEITDTTVKEAIAVIGETPFDLLLSDIGLPDGSGLDIMRLLRDQKGTRGIALSGFGNDEDLRRSKEAGFTEHLVKPVDVRILDIALRRVAG